MPKLTDMVMKKVEDRFSPGNPEVTAASTPLPNIVGSTAPMRLHTSTICSSQVPEPLLSVITTLATYSATISKVMEASSSVPATQPCSGTNSSSQHLLTRFHIFL